MILRSFGGATRCARFPASGLASTATTRSPRSVAKMLPSARVIVVLPTPPLRLITTTRREPSIGVRSVGLQLGAPPLLRRRDRG